MKHVTINSSGLGLAAAIHEPASPPRAFIILCPGYLDSKDYPHLISLAEAFSAMGILAVRFDPAGTWASEGNETDYRVTRYLQDVAAVESYIEYTYDLHEMLIGGHSLGGFVSILYAAQAATRIRAVIALCAPKEMLGTASKNWRQDGMRHSTRDLPDGNGERTYDVPWAFAEDSSQYSALQAVGTYRNTPLLLLAGGEDEIIPPEEVQTIYTAAREPKKYILLPGVEHNYRNHKDQTQRVTTAVISWCQAYSF